MFHDTVYLLGYIDNHSSYFCGDSKPFLDNFGYYWFINGKNSIAFLKEEIKKEVWHIQESLFHYGKA